VRLTASLAMANKHVTLHVIMLAGCPHLIHQLAIETVPIVYVGTTRLEGPINQWVLLNCVLQNNS